MCTPYIFFSFFFHILFYYGKLKHVKRGPWGFEIDKVLVRLCGMASNIHRRQLGMDERNKRKHGVTVPHDMIMSLLIEASRVFGLAFIFYVSYAFMYFFNYYVIDIRKLLKDKNDRESDG